MNLEDPPAFETLRVTLDGRLGRLTLAQPDRLNPIGSTALAELAAAARWFDACEASVVVVAGEGRAFSAGFDLREFGAAAASRGAPADPDAAIASTPELGAAMAEAVSAMTAVTIAAVQGPCVGGGFVLALCCDIRLAATDAWFSLPEVELGIPLAWSGVPRLVREIGPARTTELVLSARRMPASEAAAIGAVNRVVDLAALPGAVDELAATIVRRPARVIATTKQQVRASAEALAPTSGAWAGTDHLVAALRALRDELDG